MKIHPMGAELFHADGRTEMAKLMVTTRKFGNAPKNMQSNLGANKSSRRLKIGY